MKTVVLVTATLILLLVETVPVSAGLEDGADSYLDICPVTRANGLGPPGEERSPNHHGNGKIWTVLWPDGLIEFGAGRPGSISEDGVLGMKFPWWRGEGVRGRLSISGRRLDAQAPPAFGQVPEGYGDSGFQASSVLFPTEGCWEITGSVGDIDLTFVQFVRLAR